MDNGHEGKKYNAQDYEKKVNTVMVNNSTYTTNHHSLKHNKRGATPLDVGNEGHGLGQNKL